MTIIELTPPLLEPLTLAEIRAHLRLDGLIEAFSEVAGAELAAAARS